ncbi:MAG: sigma 54-interacting transcriptional regulator [Polyangiales bacterium]
MTPTRLRVPWSELSAIAAACVAMATWGASGRGVSLEGAAVALLAIGVALAPRRALEAEAPAASEAAAVAGALAAIAIATLASGRVPPSTLLRVTYAVTAGEVLALSTVLATALPLRSDTLRRALLPGVLVGAAAGIGLWSPLGWVSWLPDLRALGPVAAVVTVLFYVHAVRRPLAPIDRARLIAPGLGAFALMSAIVVDVVLGRRTSPLVMSAGLVAQVVGMTLGTGAIGLEHASRLARRCAAGAVGIAVGSLVALGLPEFAAAGAPIGTIAMILAWPAAERRLRPDGGRLLDACDEIEAGLRTVSTLTDLASAVLDPLRVASRNLRAPAALWVLDRRETFRVDVTGSAAAANLSIESERAILSWLRARPTVVFADTLRPYQVRRAELRPLIAGLDAHGALGAAPLLDGDGELMGVVLLPRGGRVEAPTYEEEVRLTAVTRSMAGSLSLISAMERSREREAKAMQRADESDARREAAESEHRHLLERERGVRAFRSLGSLDEAWVGYSATMRALAERIAAVSAGDAPLCLLAEPGAGVAAVARAIHAKSACCDGPLVILDAASMRDGDALASLVGDQRGARPRPGWFEHAMGGTLVIEDVAALGHDAHVALLDAVRDARARRIGAVDPYACKVRLVLVARRAVSELDLPSELVSRVSATLQIPPLRARADDVESLSLLAVDRACRLHAKPAVGLSSEALAALRAYPWPGNVRELFDAIDYAVARTRGRRIAVDALPPQVRASVSFTAALRTRDLDDDEDDDERALDDA